MRDTGDTAPPLEMWAGIECTVARIGDTYTDQLERTGHATRLGDLDLLADLGVTAVRYPILWERVAPDGIARADWTWADARLERLRALGIRPIIGLCHHGNGPRHTSVVDPSFATGLAAFAGAVAARYPWIEDYTPVNEPLTTARFCGLYGVWHPHGRDDRTFVRALLTQCRAVVLAMRAIRRVTAHARLVQNDDLGKTYGAPGLAARAAFDNERRWLSFDLLCGRIDPAHPLWAYLRGAGATISELAWFRAHACPPDILGIDHYLTSERLLDDRLERYPPHLHGPDGWVDVEAVRVVATGLAGPQRLLAEAWDRYRLPLAATEVHNGSTREEQLRWLLEMWDAARALRAVGADVRAVTAWALLGLYDWDSLLTQQAGHYEPGVFDLRGPRPRPTALARLVRELATGRPPTHPVLSVPGWWRRADRFFYPPVDLPADAPVTAVSTVAEVRGPALVPTLTRGGGVHRIPVRPILIVGTGGPLAAAFARQCARRGLSYLPLVRVGEEAADSVALRRALAQSRAWCVVHASDMFGGDTGMSLGGRRPHGVDLGLLAAHATGDVPFLTFSSDLVFDGVRRDRDIPYTEGDAAMPRSAAGRGQAVADAFTLVQSPAALVARTGPLFGPWDGPDDLARALGARDTVRPVHAADNVMCSPTFVPDLVDACLDLLIDGERGLWHLATAGATTWAGLVRRTSPSQAQATIDVQAAEQRPVDTPTPTMGEPTCVYRTLGSARGTLLPPLDDALARYHNARGAWRMDGTAALGVS